MPVFEYTALNNKGKSLTGIVDADSPVAARSKLRREGKFPVAVAVVQEPHRILAPSRLKRPFSFRRIKPGDLALVTRQLATLVGAGFPLVTALETLVTHQSAPALERTLAKIKDAIVEGSSFADALDPFPGTFSTLYRNMVHAGESSGTLEIVLDRLAAIMEKQEALKKRITAALAYPVLMLLVGTGVLFVLVTYIVPRITAIFEEMDQALPIPTRALMATSDFLQTWWWVMPAVGAIFLFGLVRLRATHRGRRVVDRLMLALPLIGPIVQKIDVARLTRTLGSLLENGVTLLASLGIVKNIPGNALFQDAVDAATDDVAKGRDLAAALAVAGVIPNLALQMIKVGEDSGALEQMLDKVAQAYENEVESTIMTATALLEPLMIVVMGALIGFIVLSVCLPIFEMNQLIA